jgi:carbamoyltransferase
MRREPLTHVYLGPDLPRPAGIEAELSRWRHFVDFTREDDVCRRAAQLVAEDRVIGWVQGRSEFGPRALGNRSILADPRPVRNRDRINAMVKKREGYRPFAPSVLREDAHRYFEIREGEQFPFMVFVVGVRPEMREVLGAVTHVDGTARIHTVARSTNERYWLLIDAFRDLTGIPIVLNTSLNVNAEPIVDSPADAILTYLTTDLDDLIIGDYLIRKKPVPLPQLLGGAEVTLPEHVALTSRHDSTGSHHFLQDLCDEREQPVSRDLALALTRGRVPGVEQPNGLLDEVAALLLARLVAISPDEEPGDAANGEVQRRTYHPEPGV